MKVLIACCVMFLSLSAFAVPAVVDYVIDGDTFAGVVTLGDGVDITVRVRIIDIDTPEINGKCETEIRAAHHAKNRLKELLPVGTRVDLRNIKDDKYLGRIDADVFSDGKSIGDIMVREKIARPYNGGRRRGWCE